jgi:hypothetical protein
MQNNDRTIMFSRALAFGLLALGCVTAAAGGAYVATRHNAAQARSTASAPIASAHEAATTPTDKPARSVPATEAQVTPAPVDPLPAQATATPTDDTSKSSEEGGARTPRATPKTHEPKATVSAKRPVAPLENEPGRTVPLPERTAASLPNAPTADSAPAPVTPLIPATSGDDAKSENVETPRPARFEELVLPAASVIGLQLETGLTSERARLEDRVEARVTRDVVVDGRLAIPAGSRMLGSVTQVDRGGKMKERARLAIRFHTLVLGNGDEISMRTEQIVREGEAPASDSSKKIGGAAVGGAILGAILGGGKGAMIGGMAGAGGGTAMVMAGDRNPATFQPGAIVTARLSAPATIQVQREQ